MKLSDIKVTNLRTAEIVEPKHDIYDTVERDVLVLNYTLACPLSCDFCCYGCHPKRREKMDLNLAKDLVSQASEMDSFSAIGLTGGEVFMFEDELISLSEHIRGVGMKFTVATAAHWADTIERAQGLARVLVGNGLTRANISFDGSHRKFVSTRNVINAALAFSELGIHVYIVGTYASQEESLEAELSELRAHNNIHLFTKRIAKTGRAKKAVVDYNDLDSSTLKTCYRRRHHDLVVFWDGECFPCCSTFNRATKGISIGNAFQTPLREIWTRVEYSAMFRIMKSEGFSKIIEIVNDYDPQLAKNMPKLEAYPGACSYCNSVFSNPETTRAVRAVFDQFEADQIISSIDKLKNLLGEATVARLVQQSMFSATKES